MNRKIWILLPMVLVWVSCDGSVDSDSETERPLGSTKSDLAAQQEWERKTLRYVQELNAFIEKGHKEGWENVGDGPKDPQREHLAKAAMAAVRRANADGRTENLRELWPPAHAPLIPLLDENGQDVPVVCILDDGSVVARIGASYEPGRTVHIRGDDVADVPDVGYFGRCPNRRYFGVAGNAGIAIVDGWLGPQVAMCPWPKGTEGVPEGFEVKPFEDIPTPSRIIPFPDGKKVLMVSEHGIFVLTETDAQRVLPGEEEMREHFEWSLKEYPDDDLTLYLSMEHGAVSKDGRLIAVGSQDSSHLIFDDALNLVGNVGPQSSYPHFAVFSADQSMIAFNSCHFYNGVTVGVPVGLVPGLETEAYEDDERTPILEDGARVYAAVSRDDEFIIGDANGYVRAFDLKGNRRWEQFVGSSVGDIDVSADGKQLVVSTYAGFVAFFQLDAGSQAPHQIGTGNHLEQRRWLFWSNEEKPLIW